MSALPKPKSQITIDEYLLGEQESAIRHEFVAGDIFAMAGGSDRHNRISFNLASLLDRKLKGTDCEVFIADLKVKADNDTFYYPDVFVTCEQRPQSPYFREQPVLIIEVVSPSTRQIDRREKLKVYRLIPSLKEYVIVEQDRKHVEVHRREPDGNWTTYFFNELEQKAVVEFQSVDLSTEIGAIYDRVLVEIGEGSSE